MSTSPSEPTGLDQAIAEVVEADPESLTPAHIQALFPVAIRALGHRLDEGESFPPFTAHSGVTATDAVRTASAVLGALNLEPFELALWETWGGRPWHPMEEAQR